MRFQPIEKNTIAMMGGMKSTVALTIAYFVTLAKVVEALFFVIELAFDCKDITASLYGGS
jgi:hypothetical protein